MIIAIGQNYVVKRSKRHGQKKMEIYSRTASFRVTLNHAVKKKENTKQHRLTFKNQKQEDYEQHVEISIEKLQGIIHDVNSRLKMTL